MAKPYNDGKAYYSFHINKGQPYFHADFVAGAVPAAKTLISRGWIKVDEFNNHRLNDVGLEAAKTEPKPIWKPPAAPTATKEDLQVLAELESCCRSRKWATPLDCGGRNGSNHSAILTRLTRMGFARCRKSMSFNMKTLTGDEIVPEPTLMKKPKGSRAFQITESGKTILKASRPV